MPSSTLLPDSPQVLMTLLGLFVAIVVLLFGNNIVFRFRDWLVTRRQRIQKEKKMNTPLVTSPLSFLKEAERLIEEAKELLPKDPPIVSQDIIKVHQRLVYARDNIQKAAGLSNMTSDTRLTLEAMVRHSSYLPDYHIDRALTSSFKLANYTKLDKYDVQMVSSELAILGNLILQLQTRLRTVQQTFDK